MKIKTRDQRIREYNTKYTKRISDPEKALREYFVSRNWNLEKAIKKAKKKMLQIEEEREYETIHITMYEYPMKTDRPRTFRGHTYSPNAAANHNYFEKAIKQVVKTFKLINTPAEVQIDAYIEMPSQVKPDEVILFEAKVLNPIDYPDYDNIGKCYTDMFKNVLAVDDDLFWKGTVRKFYSVTPRVEIMIRYLVKHESDFIYKKIKSRKSVKQAIETGQCVVKRMGDNA